MDRQLSQKHRDVFDRLLVGLSRKEIADQLGISLATVDQRIAFVRNWFGVGKRSDAIIRYAQEISGGCPADSLREELANRIARSRLPKAGDPAARFKLQRLLIWLVIGFGLLSAALQIATLVMLARALSD